MKKFFRVLAVTSLFTFATATAVFAGTWQDSGSGWKYQKDDSSYLSGDWLNDNGSWYHFDSNGIMQTGWIQVDGSWYYMEPSGIMRTSTLTENNFNYLFDANGICVNPNGDAAQTSAVLTESQYLDKIHNLTVTLNESMTKAQTQLDNLNYYDTSGAKRIIEELKTPFREFANLQAPSKYSAVQAKYKSGCESMIEYLDLCITLIDMETSGKSWSDADVQNIVNRLSTLIITIGNDLAEAGSLLLKSY